MSTLEDSAPSAEAATDQKRRAIIVDDSRATRSLLRRLLANLGYEVVEAGNGAEALDVLANNERVDLALVDWNMPVMDGLEFVKTLRTKRAYADMIVVMVSAESDQTKVARALMMGADEFVIKPLTAEILQVKLEMLEVRS
jgi:two-component system chemotaxis response regulator CheY